MFSPAPASRLVLRSSPMVAGLPFWMMWIRGSARWWGSKAWRWWERSPSKL